MPVGAYAAKAKKGVFKFQLTICKDGTIKRVDDKGGTLPPVLAVKVLDDFLAALVLEVDVNIRRLAALLADEALKQDAHARRVNLGDANAVADH